MYHTCVSSSLSLRCKATFSYSFNDHSYFQYDRFDRYPLTSSSHAFCSCCCCSNYSVHRVPVSPNVTCGFRQSALIQWSPSRRFVFGSAGDRCDSPSPVQDVGRDCCCGHACNLKEKTVSSGRGRWGEGRFRCMASESKRERQHLRKFDDVEAMLSLLVEEVDEECFNVRERIRDSSTRINVEKRGSRDANSYEKKKMKKDMGSRLLGSKPKGDSESARIKLRLESNRENEYKKKKEEIDVLRKEKRRARKSASSCSSYHSCASLGELESDTEVRVTQEVYGGESASRFERDKEETGELTYQGEIMEEVKTHGGVAGVMTIGQDKPAAGSYTRLSAVDLECRKKSEKKLTEVDHKTVADIHEVDHRRSSSSHQQLVDIQRKSNLASSVAGGIRKGDQITGQSESRMKYKHFTGVQEINMGNESIAGFHKQNSGWENMASGAGSSVQETRHEHTETDGIDITLTSTSNRQFEARMKKHEESTSAVSSVQGQVKGSNMTDYSNSGQIDAAREFQQLTETSAPIVQSDSMKKLSRSKEQQFVARKQAISQKENEIGAQDMGSTSVIHSTASQSTDTQQISGKRTSNKESSVIKSTQETLLRYDQTRERVSQIGLIKETTTSIKNDASSSRSSSVLETQSAAQNTGVVVGDHTISQAVMVPPPSQFVARRPLHIEPTNDFRIQEISSSSLGSGSESLYRSAGLHTTGSQHRRGEAHEKPLIFTSDDDPIGSAGRLEESSAGFVGEFLEKATHEISTSEGQHESASEEFGATGHEHYQQTLSEHGSGDLNSKKQDSRRSSRSSGAKGPSEEIWDVPDPSIHVPAGTQAAVGTSPSTSTVSKTSRSLWNVVSDIVRLRWATRSESHTSTRRSGGRSSPNQSTSSEAWFSGHEPDGSSDGRARSKAKSVSQESENPQLITNNSGGQESGSSSSRSKQKMGHVDMDAVAISSSGISGSGSAFKGISSVATDGNSGKSGSGVEESSLPVPSIRLRRSPHVGGTSGTGKIDLSASTSGSIVQEQVVGTPVTETSVTEGKSEEFKRRKLQRTNQVVKDRFDEWEEAYMLESEQRKTDEMFMREALLEAKKAGDSWEVPVGAVLVQHGKIIARGYNLVEELRDSTAHAEMICIREASNQLRTWRLSDTTLYITLEPCPMCAGAILQARIDSVVWGAPNKLLGADGSWIRLFPNGGEGGSSVDVTDKPPPPVHPFHPKMTVRRGVLAAECADVMQEFFRLRRRKKKTSLDSPPAGLPVTHHPSKFLSKMHHAFHILFCL